MKTTIIGSTLALACITGQAFAACAAGGSVTQLDETGITTVLSGNTVCVAGAGGWKNQEAHAAGGDIIDYKEGPSSAKDPSSRIGSWSTSGTGTAAQITYTYDTFGSPASVHTFSVFDNGAGSYSFCNGGTEVAAATVVPGAGGCGP